MCFRTGVVGAPGMSMHRDAAYAYHASRTWPAAGVLADPARYIANHASFVAYYLAAMALPTKAAAQALVDRRARVTATHRGARIGDGSGAGSVLVIDRKGKRALHDVHAIVADARRASGGRRVLLVDWANHTAREQAALALSADLVLAVHGAGAINSLFLRPGAAWVDLLPPRALNYAPTFLATAQRIGVRWYTLPLREFAPGRGQAHNQPWFDVDLPAMRAVIALALGTEPRRRRRGR